MNCSHIAFNVMYMPNHSDTLNRNIVYYSGCMIVHELLLYGLHAVRVLERIMTNAAEIVQECDGSGLCSHSSPPRCEILAETYRPNHMSIQPAHSPYSLLKHQHLLGIKLPGQMPESILRLK